MIKLTIARQLKAAGLVWQPALHDFFAIPDRDLDDQVFVLSDIQVTIEKMQGIQMVSFQGASEWALDSLVKEEAVWLPREDQLRQALEAALLGAGRPEFRLRGGLDGYHLDYVYKGQSYTIHSEDVSQALAEGLLCVLSS